MSLVEAPNIVVSALTEELKAGVHTIFSEGVTPQELVLNTLKACNKPFGWSDFFVHIGYSLSKMPRPVSVVTGEAHRDRIELDICLTHFGARSRVVTDLICTTAHEFGQKICKSRRA